METTLGAMVIELDEEAAPITTANFLAHVDAGFYDGTDGQGATIFHRVIDGFVAQGGGFTEAQVQKPTMAPIVNESGNGLTNVRGSIAMARTMDPDSATSQFYFNLVDNPFLDDPPGYAVFGQIVEGLEVMDALGAVATDGADVPIEPVIILSTTVE
ncbi:MAG: peptidylprolyl isomerase [Myxococcales bacterium]|nr:peptidylprolyl isomerase [Myxococcales bacterium]